MPQSPKKRKATQSATDLPNVRVTIVREGKVIGDKVLDEAETIVGRGGRAGIYVHDPFVSTKHCSIELSDGRAYVRDHGSRNGTLVNGRRCLHGEVLDGDTINLGKTSLVINIIEDVVGRDRDASADDHEPTHIIPDGQQPRESSLSGALSHNLQEQVMLNEKLREHSKAHGGPETVKAFDEVGDEIGAMVEEELDEKSLKEFRDAETYMLAIDFDEDDDEDAYDRDFEEPFDLLEKVVKESGDKRAAQFSSRDEKGLEVVVSEQGHLRRIERLSKRGRFYHRTAAGRVRLARTRGDHGFDLLPPSGASGYLLIGGARRKLSEVGLGTPVQLGHADSAIITVDGITYHFRYVTSKALPPAKLWKGFDPELKKSYGISFLTHFAAIAVMLLLFYVGGGANNNDRFLEKEKNRFAKIDLEEVKPKKPEPKKPEITKVAEKKAKPPAPKKRVVKKSKKKPRMRMVKRGRKPSRLRQAMSNSKPRTGAPKRPNVKVENLGVLGALRSSPSAAGGMTKKTKTGLVSAITNLGAVKTKNGAQTFSVAGVMAKTGGNDLRIIRVADPNTKGAGRGSGSRNYGMVASVGSIKVGNVRGLVIGGDGDATWNPDDTGATVRGSLDRDQIASVIAKHLGEIRACYERSLMSNPGLFGKLDMHWVINGGGKVNSTRIKRSTMRDASVHSCMASVIKRMRFPKPRGGGLVEVTFPFVFKSNG